MKNRQREDRFFSYIFFFFINSALLQSSIRRGKYAFLLAALFDE